MAGRQGKLTSEVQKNLADVFASGATIKDACAYVGITAATFHNWIGRGALAKSGNYFDFFDIITRARANGRLQALKTISIAMRDEEDKHAASRSAQWFLERSDPAGWARRTYSKIEGLDELLALAGRKGVDASDLFNAMIAELALDDSTTDSEAGQ